MFASFCLLWGLLLAVERSAIQYSSASSVFVSFFCHHRTLGPSPFGVPFGGVVASGPRQAPSNYFLDKRMINDRSVADLRSVFVSFCFFHFGAPACALLLAAGASARCGGFAVFVMFCWFRELLLYSRASTVSTNTPARPGYTSG